ncbi:MAG TPA: hypothetical protein VMZ11_04765, partial [Mycobacteriales bacterium]|nr:hypothetical protein [Mycobacteriales bacterium]
GLVSPALAAELPRLQGLLALARGEDPEPQLRAAITSLEAFGLVPDRARTEHALAVWLLGQGRPDEAESLAAAAAATYEQLGATAWLAELRRQVGSPVESGAPA